MELGECTIEKEFLSVCNKHNSTSCNNSTDNSYNNSRCDNALTIQSTSRIGFKTVKSNNLLKK